MLIDRVSDSFDSIRFFLKLSTIHACSLYSDIFTGLAVLLLRSLEHDTQKIKKAYNQYLKNNPVNALTLSKSNFVPKMTILLTALILMQYCQNQSNTVSEVLN